MEFLPADQIVPIATLIGAGLLGLLAAFGTWWGRRRSTGDQIVEVAGALVDSKAVERLTAAIEAHALENVQARTDAKNWHDAFHKLARMIEGTARTLRELRGELRTAMGIAISIGTESLRRWGAAWQTSVGMEKKTPADLSAGGSGRHMSGLVKQ